METLVFLLIFPLAWPFVAKLIWGHELTVREIGINVAIGVVVVTVGWFGGRAAMTSDFEVHNGEVLRKEIQPVSCEHSYSCNCREDCSTDSTGRRSCSTTCDTCYEHLRDFDHVLVTNVGDVEIDRVDRQGVSVPPRYESARIGDPVALRKHFVNYIKGAPDSLFNALAERSAHQQFHASLPAYPDQVYDYHYVNRVLTTGPVIPDLANWNAQLAQLLRKLGPGKQANAVVVFTSSTDSAYADALRAEWLGGKKNDVVLVIGAPNYPEIAWTRVVSWTDNELFKSHLEQGVRDLKTATPEAVLGVLFEKTMAEFERKHMKDFEYLKWSIEPPTWLLWLLFVLSIVASVGASIWLSRNNERVYGGMPRLRRR